MHGKAAKDCTPEEIKAEVWEQLKRSLNYGDVRHPEGREAVHSWSLDPSIIHHKDGSVANEEPLLVNLVDTWKLRPEAASRIPNLFLGSDYVRTYADLATMEAANEAGRRAVNGILDAAGSGASHCGVWPLHEPEIFAPWRELDFIRYTQGLPWDDTLVRLGLSFSELADKAIMALEGGWEEHAHSKAGTTRSVAAYQAFTSFADRQAQAGVDLRAEARRDGDRRAARPRTCESARGSAGRADEWLTPQASPVVRAGWQIIPK